MHSRIFQLKPRRKFTKKKSNLLTADCIAGNNCFLGPIADYTSDDCDRREDFDWLINNLRFILGDELEKHVTWHFAEDGSNMPEAYIIFRSGFKRAYMQKQYETFLKQTGEMTLENFMCPQYIFQLEESICDKFGFYIAEEANNIMPLDKFIRRLPSKKCKYWLGATVDYHC